MKPAEHANLLSIFFWIYSVIQLFAVLLIGLYVGIMGFATVAIALEGKKEAMSGGIMLGIIVLVFLLITLIGLLSLIVNIVAGYGLRKSRSWARRWGIIASIMSIFSFICGGIFLLPFGTALGIYGLWFFLNEENKQYLNSWSLPYYNM
jgi:hypothetical protein